MAVNNNPLLYCKDLNLIHSILFNINSKKILDLINAQFTQEDLEGDSVLVVGVLQYQMANILVLLFYKDFISGEYSFTYLMEFYKVDEIRECLRCLNIDLYNMFLQVGIDITLLITQCSDGVEHINIESTLQIEGLPCNNTNEEEPVGEVVDIATLLSQNNSCILLIN